MKLIIRVPNWVGDAVMALPAVDIARDITGASRIVVMARRATAGLYTHHPDVDQVLVIDDKNSGFSGIRQAAAPIKNDRFDIGLILPPSFSSALIFKLGKVKNRVGYTGDNRSLLLTRRVKPPVEKMHRVHRYLHLLENLSGRKLDFRPPRVYISREDIEGGSTILGKYGLSYKDRYAVIAPQAVAESRRWGVENYAAFAKRIIDDVGLKVILIGTASDKAPGEKVRNGHEAIINLSGLTSLPSAAAILSHARLFVGNDSGLAHLAGAVGSPVVVLSGADDPSETSPMCEKKVVIIKDIECISCVKNLCPKSGEEFMRCMKLITVAEVFDAAQKTAKL